MATVDRQLGAVARPAQVHIVSHAAQDPLRQAAAACDPGRLRGPDAGDLTTMEDPASLQQIKDVMQR